MIEHSRYCLTVSDQQHLMAQAENVFDLVWRFDFTAPGFCVLDTGIFVKAEPLPLVLIPSGTSTRTPRLPSDCAYAPHY